MKEVSSCVQTGNHFYRCSVCGDSKQWDRTWGRIQAILEVRHTHPQLHTLNSQPNPFVEIFYLICESSIAYVLVSWENDAENHWQSLHSRHHNINMWLTMRHALLSYTSPFVALPWSAQNSTLSTQCLHIYFCYNGCKCRLVVYQHKPYHTFHFFDSFLCVLSPLFQACAFLDGIIWLLLHPVYGVIFEWMYIFRSQLPYRIMQWSPNVCKSFSPISVHYISKTANFWTP